LKAVILAGGRGKRVNEISDSTNKCLFEVAGKSVIQYSLDNILETEIDEVIIVVGYFAEEIINHYGNRYKNLRIKYVIQLPQMGLVHALECAQKTLDGDDFLLMLGDEITINSKHQDMIDEFYKERALGICGVIKTDDKNNIRKTYSLIHDENNIIFRLIEKPRNPINNIMGTGNCVFKNELIEYIKFTPIHHERKEKEFPDLIQCAIDDGCLVKLFYLCSDYVNINSLNDLKIADKLIKEYQNVQEEK